MARNRTNKPQPVPRNRMGSLIEEFVAWMRVRNFSFYTQNCRRSYLVRFARWANERGIEDPMEVTRPVLESYQRSLYYHRQKNGKPLTFRTQYGRLVPVRTWFRWMVRNNHILHNPASDLDMPKIGTRLPRAVLNEEEVERVMLQPDIRDPLGVRDRAILETFYSTGIRRMELVNLKLFQVDHLRGTVSIWQGKGKKDRVVPIGERALLWLDKYLREARPQLVMEPDEGSIFLTVEGGPRVRGAGESRKERRVSHAAAHDGDAHARKRRGHPLHPGDARPQQVREHANLHAGVHPAVEENPLSHASWRDAGKEKTSQHKHRDTR